MFFRTAIMSIAQRTADGLPARAALTTMPKGSYSEYVTYAIISLTFGLSAGMIGRMKGSSFWIWFLIGAILPVLGTICALFSRSERVELRRHCEQCRTVLPLYAQVCTVCGRDLDFPDYAIASELPDR